MADSKVVSDSIGKKTCIVVGTRPGIIKMSPVIDELERRDVESFTIHAGQHYSYELDGKMFEDLGLDTPKYRLDEVKDAEFHGEQTAAMLTGIESILLEERPENVLVLGDPNLTLATALAARKLQLNVGHVEAGLRSDDWRMPEEHNRVIVDHISEYLFAPTVEARQNAIEDNVKGDVFVTGNTIVDAVERNIKVAREQSNIHDQLSLQSGEYAAFTAHREENVDDQTVLSDLIEIVERIPTELDLEVVYPIHPRTEKRLGQFDLDDELRSLEGLHLIDPVGYLDFLRLLSDADVVLTDSGGIQEETCILGVPCVTLRENTERPETVSVGANVVAGTDPDTVLNHAQTMRTTESDWENPFGDGEAAKRVVDITLDSNTEDPTTRTDAV